MCHSSRASLRYLTPPSAVYHPRCRFEIMEEFMPLPEVDDTLKP